MLNFTYTAKSFYTGSDIHLSMQFKNKAFRLEKSQVLLMHCKPYRTSDADKSSSLNPWFVLFSH